MEEEISIKIPKEKAEMFYSILISAAAQLCALNNDGYIPINKVEVMEFIEELRKEIQPHCNAKEKSKEEKINFICYQLNKIGIKVKKIEEERKNEVVDIDKIPKRKR